ncbi:MAG TPA: VWA domain-containing protein, partial [Pirellulales bacterium]|nr:VWA domain-containing protein [Pirellulales bacterium]
ESTVDREHTNLAGAMKLAQASFPHDTARRIVIISDGNQNMGDAIKQARALAEAGIGIDVVPIRSAAESDVAVEKVVIPADVRRGQPFDLHAVLSNTAGRGQPSAPVEGRMQIIRKTGNREQTISDQAITLEPGKRVFRIREEIEQPDFYTYEARFVPNDPGHDATLQNNQATGFTHVRGSGQVLLLEDFEHRGDFDLMVERLRTMNLEVTVRTTRPEELFTDLAQLQSFDTVLLANVPREQFSDAQVEILVRNTQSMGSGLVMLGGENSFGAGGWTNTPLEEAMPVDFQIKNAKVAPVGALVLVIDRSGSMAGGKLEMAKASAIATARQLGDQDFLGVVAFDGDADWVARLTRASLRDQIAARVERLGAGGGTNMYPGMTMAFHALSSCNASVKHMILLTDGNTEGSGYTQLAQAIRHAGITISAIAVGDDAARPLLEEIAQKGGGKFYAAKDPRTLPRIFQKEARRVARPLVFEREQGFQPQIRFPHEMIQGIDGQLPPITGYVLTHPKTNPLVEIALISPLPGGTNDNSILASWTYGLGRAVVFTTDTGKRWATSWTGWAGYDKLFSQVVRWSMRPTEDSGKFTVSTDVQDSKVKVVVTALDKDDEFLNFLNLGSTVVGP